VIPTRIAALLALPLALAPWGCSLNYRPYDPVSVKDTPLDVLSLRWQRSLVQHPFLSYKPQEWASAAISPEGVVFIGSTSGLFSAYRGTDGRRLWSIRAESAITSRPLYSPQTGCVFFGADDGRMYAVEARTGKVRWVYATQGTISPRPAYGEGMLLFTTSEGRLYALDARNGKWSWQYDREPPEGFTIQGYSGAAIHGGVAYTGFSDGYLVAQRVRTGDLLWTRSLRAGKVKFVDVDATPVVTGELLLTTSYAAGVFALSRESGSVIWQYPVEGATNLVLHDNRIFLTAPKKGLMALDLRGHQLWRQAMARGVPATPVAWGPYLFITNTEAGLYVASSATGRLLQYFDPGKGVSARPAVGAGLLVVLGNGGALFTFQIANQRPG
jgi:outer membrane protein assembly factor BamB